MAEMEKQQLITKLWRLSVEQLNELCTTATIEVPATKKTMLKAMRNAVVRHLSSETIEESEDEGMQLFQQLN